MIGHPGYDCWPDLCVCLPADKHSEMLETYTDFTGVFDLTGVGPGHFIQEVGDKLRRNDLIGCIEHS